VVAAQGLDGVDDAEPSGAVASGPSPSLPRWFGWRAGHAGTGTTAPRRRLTSTGRQWLTSES